MATIEMLQSVLENHTPAEIEARDPCFHQALQHIGKIMFNMGAKRYFSLHPTSTSTIEFLETNHRSIEALCKPRLVASNS